MAESGLDPNLEQWLWAIEEKFATHVDFWCSHLRRDAKLAQLAPKIQALESQIRGLIQAAGQDPDARREIVRDGALAFAMRHLLPDIVDAFEKRGHHHKHRSKEGVQFRGAAESLDSPDEFEDANSKNNDLLHVAVNGGGLTKLLNRKTVLQDNQAEEIDV